MKRLFNIAIYIVLIIVRSLIFSQTIDSETIYVFFTFPPYLPLSNLTPEIFILSIIWNSPTFYLMYSSFKTFSTYIRENFIYFLIRNSSVRKTLSYIIRRIVLNLIVSIVAAAIVVILVFNKISLIIDAEYIYSVFIYILYSTSLILLTILAYILTLKESVVAWFIMFYMIILAWLSYLEYEVVLELLFQINKTEHLSITLVCWLIIGVSFTEIIYFVARSYSKLF